MAYVICDFPECDFLAKLQCGQRRFCEDHHLESLETNPAYREAVDQYQSDPELVTATATFERILQEEGGVNALIFMFPPLEAAAAAFEEAKAAARERQQPGIHEAEAAADKAHRAEQAHIDEIYYALLLASDKANHADDEGGEEEMHAEEMTCCKYRAAR